MIKFYCLSVCHCLIFLSFSYFLCIFMIQYRLKSVWFTVDESVLMPEFAEGTSLEEQLRVLLDRLETAESNYPCK